MSTTKRIEYIDALRGFTMILVVTWHIYALCIMHIGDVLLFEEYDLSYNNFFRLFRMPLFYFISGFVFYKLNRQWNIPTLKKFMTSKVRVQLFSTLVFFLLYCWLYQKDIMYSIFELHKTGYWFTYVLFVYFVIYIGIDMIICWICRKTPFNNITIITSILAGLILYYSINNGFLLNLLSPQMTTLLSILKWQYFIFFSLGCLIHKYYDTFINVQRNNYVKGAILVLFVSCTICIFYQNSTVIIIHNYILKLFAGILGIVLVMFLFKEHESHFSNTTRLGKCLQYIGKHTLDIYFLHYFFLPYNMSYVGQWLLKYPNPILEFFTSVILALIVISVCLLVSRIIRMSPLLTYLLLGGKSYQEGKKTV